MRCPNCGYENEMNSQFCGNCGGAAAAAGEEKVKGAADHRYRGAGGSSAGRGYRIRGV